MRSSAKLVPHTSVRSVGILRDCRRRTVPDTSRHRVFAPTAITNSQTSPLSVRRTIVDMELGSSLPSGETMLIVYGLLALASWSSAMVRFIGFVLCLNRRRQLWGSQRVGEVRAEANLVAFFKLGFAGNSCDSARDHFYRSKISRILFILLQYECSQMWPRVASFRQPSCPRTTRENWSCLVDVAKES